MPKVSVVMPVYSSEKYVGEAIESILVQTYKDFELIVIDDCSKDSSAKIIEKYTNDSRVHFIKNETNQGFLYGLNKGIELAKGEYIARLDDDDVSKIKKEVTIVRDEVVGDELLEKEYTITEKYRKK